jgi:hypothetical protein
MSPYARYEQISRTGPMIGLLRNAFLIMDIYSPSPEYPVRRRRTAGMKGKANRAETRQREGGLGYGAISL